MATQEENIGSKGCDQTEEFEQKPIDLSADGETESKDELLPSMGILPPDESTGEATNSKEQQSDTSSPSDVLHKVKRIKWKSKEVPIITQNNNGPCPLIAILNALVLKGNITLPCDRQELSGGELVSIVGNAVFDVPRRSVPSEMRQYVEQNTEDAVSLLHKLLTGLDVNVKFSGVRDFEFTQELSIFDVLGVSLYHGWVVDPGNECASVVSDLSYNQLVNNIIIWQHEATQSQDDNLFMKSMLCEEFLQNSVSQLTIHGLFELGESLREDEIAVLFRNNHFSTLYKMNGQLYQLLTDQGFLHEKAVWETLTDVDATFSSFVTGTFQKLESCEPAPPSSMTKEQQIDSDAQLAAMLQKEAENEQKREEYFDTVVNQLGEQNLSDEEIARRLQERENEYTGGAQNKNSNQNNQQSNPKSVAKPKKDCAIL